MYLEPLEDVEVTAEGVLVKELVQVVLRQSEVC